MNVGLLLGSFDPPHIGHISVASYALNNGMDMVWIIPCWNNPFKEKQTAFGDRVTMCFKTFKDMPDVCVMSDDAHLKSTTTYDFLTNAVFMQNKSNNYYLIVGSDIDITKWYNGQYILDHYAILRVPRLGYVESEVGIKCSSSYIRTHLNDMRMEPYLNSEVIKYIKGHNLYD